MLKLTILTPEKTLFNDQVESVALPGAYSPFTAFPNHAPMISSLQAGGVVGYVREGKRETLAVEGGVVKVLNNCVTILVDNLGIESTKNR